MYQEPDPQVLWRQMLYEWKKAYPKGEGLISGKPFPRSPALRTRTEIEEKVLRLPKPGEVPETNADGVALLSE